MKTILVPVDFTETAKKGIDYALMLTKNNAAKIVLINAWNLPETHPSMMFTLHDAVREQHESAMLDLLEKTKKETDNKNLLLEGIVDAGNIVALIKNTASKINADFIIMGTEGATGFKEVFLGSNASEVIEHTPCPIMAIPFQAAINPPKKIVFASNFETQDIEDLKKLITWFKPFNCSFSIIHVGDPKHKDLNDFEDFIINAKEKLFPESFNYSYLSNDNVQDGIQEYIKNNKIDLITLSVRKHSFLQQFLNRSLTKKIAYHTTIPLIAFPIENKHEQIKKQAALSQETSY